MIDFIVNNADAIAYIATGLFGLALPVFSFVGVKWRRKIKYAIQALEDGKITAEEIKQILTGEAEKK